jgi:hypothetical protein
MPQLIARSPQRLASPLLAALIVSLVSGCATTSSAPANPSLSGRWQIDKAASDLVDTKVSNAIEATEAQLRKHAGNSGYGNGGTYGGGYGRGGGGRGPGGGGPGGGGGPPDNGQGDTGDTGDDTAPTSLEDFDAFKRLGPDFAEISRRLLGVLTPPNQLQFESGSDYVRIKSDNAPPFDYHPDDEFSRIDEYGTAKIDSGWTPGNAFELRARYSSHATLVKHFEVDARKDTLTVTYHLRDPMVGKIDLSTVYHRS